MLFFFSDTHEGHAVRTEIKTDELHDTLAPHDVAAEIADDINDVLCEVLELTRLFEIAFLPCFENAGEATTIVVGGATNATLCTAHGQTREDSFVLPMQHIEFTILIATATIVFVETLKGVLDTCEVGDATIYGFQEIIHREESSVEGRDVIIVERKFGSG